MRVDVVDDVGLVGAHQPQHLGAEVGEAVAADDARHAAVVVAGQVERVLVGLDVGVGAAVGAQVLAEQARAGRGDRGRIGQRAQRVLEIEQEAVAAPRRACCSVTSTPCARMAVTLPSRSRIGW